MKTGDLYQIMMSTVCRHTGVGELDMIESNKEECVDARYILIYFLSKYLTDEDISKNTGLTRQHCSSASQLHSGPKSILPTARYLG